MLPTSQRIASAASPSLFLPTVFGFHLAESYLSLPLLTCSKGCSGWPCQTGFVCDFCLLRLDEGSKTAPLQVSGHRGLSCEGQPGAPVAPSRCTRSTGPSMDPPASQQPVWLDLCDCARPLLTLSVPGLHPLSAWPGSTLCGLHHCRRRLHNPRSGWNLGLPSGSPGAGGKCRR